MGAVGVLTKNSKIYAWGTLHHPKFKLSEDTQSTPTALKGKNDLYLKVPFEMGD